jgi:hypothetical protein
MSRNFGITSGAAPGEQRRPRSYSAHDTQRAESNVISLADHFPSRGDRLNSERLTAAPFFIPEPPLERGKFTQALLDVLNVSVGIVFVCALASSVPIAIYLLFFV